MFDKCQFPPSVTPRQKNKKRLSQTLGSAEGKKQKNLETDLNTHTALQIFICLRVAVTMQSTTLTYSLTSGVKLSSFSSQYRLLSIQVQSSESLQRMPSSMRHRFHSSKVSPLSSSVPFPCCSNIHRSRESCRVEYTVFQPILATISAECVVHAPLVHNRKRARRTDGRFLLRFYHAIVGKQDQLQSQSIRLSGLWR